MSSLSSKVSKLLGSSILESTSIDALYLSLETKLASYHGFGRRTMRATILEYFDTYLVLADLLYDNSLYNLSSGLRILYEKKKKPSILEGNYLWYFDEEHFYADLYKDDYFAELLNNSYILPIYLLNSMRENNPDSRGGRTIEGVSVLTYSSFSEALDSAALAFSTFSN